MTYTMDDGTVVKTEKATQTWHENKAADKAWDEWLHRSRRGRYWIERIRLPGQTGSPSYADWISKRTAAQWLIFNGHELPEDLKALEAEVSQ